MRILVDTQCWLWLNSEPERLSPTTIALLESETTDLLLSAASVWEIAIKHATGKLTLPVSPGEFVETRLRNLRTSSLPITHPHALQAGMLPRYHHDPFDRMLVAQAQTERLRLLTADPQLRRYDVELIDA
jgi:PIN domain nuclease of toxin-antitoxin system